MYAVQSTAHYLLDLLSIQGRGAEALSELHL